MFPIHDIHCAKNLLSLNLLELSRLHLLLYAFKLTLAFTRWEVVQLIIIGCDAQKPKKFNKVVQLVLVSCQTFKHVNLPFGFHVSNCSNIVLGGEDKFVINNPLRLVI